MHDVDVRLHATPAQRDLIDRAAGLLRKSRSDFMVDAAYVTACEIVRAHGLFNLDIDMPQDFAEPLDATEPPSAGLQRLIAVVAVWVTSAD